MSSPVNNTVRIHVDSEGQSSQHDASSSNGHKSAVEMQSVGVNAATSSGKNATAESINVSDVNGSPDPTSPQAGLISETFPLSVENIQRLFNTETTPADVINIIDKEWGGVSGLMGSLNTQETGLDLDALATQSRSETERIAIYGQNVLPLAKKKSFLDFCWEVLEDTMLRILMVAGAISIGLGLAEDRQTGWYEGAAIWFAIILVTLVSAVNNYQQQKQFAEVDISKELDAVTVIRSGKQFSMDPTEILVGDLVALAAGQRIPADGVLIQMKGKEVKVNESSATGETGLVDKKPHTKPLMMSGTEVVSGSCIMLVVLVGINTSYGQTLASLVEEDRQTPLQKKLAYVATLIGWMGTGFAACTFIALLGYWIHEVAGHKPTTTEWSELLDIAVVCISIIVVAVPEGLPLAVTVSLAYSMKAMLKDHILVRELAACETMGNATAICSDKTGTLTQNRMTVQRVYIQQQMQDRPPPREELHPATLHLLEQGIILNSAAWIEEEHVDMTAHPSDWAWKDGNQTEIALLSWLIAYGYNVNQIRAKFAATLRATEPFDSIKKYSSIIVERTPDELSTDPTAKKYRQFFKGAAEAIIAQTDRQTDKTGKPVPLAPGSNNLHRDLLDTVSEFSRRGLRVIAFSYRDLDELPKKKEEEPIVIKEQTADETAEGATSISVLKDEQKESAAVSVPEIPEEEFVAPITDAILIGMVGLSDPLRPTSYRSVRLCQRAGIVVRMVTGDHVETARFISRECGIWTSKNHLCMTGAEFRKMMAEEDEETKKLKVSRLRVLARSSPQDKQVLVKFLQTQGEVVAATGDGTNDAPALKAADVGIAMFLSGTAVCKSAADLWLMDDNFASIVAAVVWGRCVFDNIRKFLAFQLTVNVVALFLSLIGALSDHPLPLTTVQLLWINLIMDTAAAVALGTEQPVPEELLSRLPKPPDVPLVSKAMWFKIFSQGAYQLAVLLFIMYRVDLIFPDVVVDSTDHKTLIFNIFVWMQIGNSMNARRVLPTPWVFDKIFENGYFLGIMFGAGCMQVLMVEVFGSFANTTHQTGPQWGCALLCGFFIVFTGIAYAYLWRLIVSIWPYMATDDTKQSVRGDHLFEGAHLDDRRYSFKRPDNADEISRLRAASRASFSHRMEAPADGPVALALGGGAGVHSGSSSRLISSMSARRANPTGSARRVNQHPAVTFQAVGDDHAPHGGDLEAVAAAPIASGPSKEQLAASASWPRAPVDEGAAANSKAMGSHQKQNNGGVQVIEELDELL